MDWLDRMAQRTPTVPLADDETGCTLWLKLEYTLPSGSTKDRVAAAVLRDGLARGAIGEQTTVVEASSGSTSIALAMACAVLGLRFVAVMPDAVSNERVLLIRRYGAEVVLADGMLGALDRAAGMAKDDPAVFLCRQFENPLNAEAHRLGTAPELMSQVDGPIHGFVAGVGTGGTLMGVGAALREAGLDTRIAQVLPGPGAPFAGQPEVCGGIPGIVEGFSSLLDTESIGADDDIEVADADSVATARELCARGLGVGPSSGLNVAGARAMARRLGPGHNVATVLCDRVERYFSTSLFDDLRAD
ncbi:MAG TPA: cysteine synthase family protein [Acidimicrobiales bacterium]|nr:cysteine synthase family protein [Acidimicrobiales bacterium]